MKYDLVNNNMNLKEIRKKLKNRQFNLQKVFLGVDPAGDYRFSYIVRSPDREGGIFLDESDYKELISQG